MINLPANLARFVARQREQADKLRAQHGIEPQSWYRITNQADPDEAEVMLYDDIGGWYGATADTFIADLRGVTAPNLRVRINSPGGSVFEGIAIANALRSHPANITIQVDGIAASIASVIAMAGDRIEMAPNTMMMIHDASGLCMGNASDMEEMAELLDLISDNIADAYSARAGGTREDWRERMRAETWYLPEDAVEAGLADEATKAPKAGEPATEPSEDEPEPEMRRQFDLTAYGYTGPEQPEKKPALTIDIGAVLGKEFVEQLRASVLKEARVEPEAPEPEPALPDEPAAEPGPSLETGATEDARAEPGPLEPAAEPVDEWSAMVAHLTKDDADDWSALVSHLTEPASPRAATDA